MSYFVIKACKVRSNLRLCYRSHVIVGLINDLPSEVVTYHLELFADDTKAIASVRDAIDRKKVQLDLSAIEKCCQENHLTLCKKNRVLSLRS